MQRTEVTTYAALLLLEGCIIPLPLRVAVPESEYRADCECVICTDVDPDTLECLNTITDTTTIFECDEPPGAVDEFALERHFRAVCDRGDAANIDCELVELDMEGSPFVVLYQEEACPRDTTEPTTAEMISPRELSAARVSASVIEFRTSDGDGETSVTGEILFRGGNCAQGSCPMEIVALHLRGADFSLAGRNVTAPTVFNTTLGRGTFTAGGLPIFTIDRGTLEVVASGAASERRALRAANEDFVGAGFLNQPARLMTFAQTFRVDGTDMALSLFAEVDNFVPTAHIVSGARIECNEPGAALVSIPAEIVDVDGNDFTTQWFVDGVLVATNVSVLGTVLPLGPHMIELVVFDADGGEARDRIGLVVEDTTPPAFAAEPASICLWPPNHERVIITAEDIGLIVTDACDPHPNIVFTSASSSQPDNGVGDGNTTGDLVIHDGAVCVRSERQGPGASGRTYAVSVTATDAAGNSSSQVATIKVPHDRGSSERCDLTAGVAASDFDSRCLPLLSPRSPSDDAAAGGCRLAGSSTGSDRVPAFLALLALLAIRRRRSE